MNFLLSHCNSQIILVIQVASLWHKVIKEAYDFRLLGTSQTGYDLKFGTCNVAVSLRMLCINCILKRIFPGIAGVALKVVYNK